MTQNVTQIAPLGTHPYLTVAEFKQAPTAMDVDDLVGGGSLAINDVELGNVLARASSWIDGYCGQVLAATQDTETFRARTSRDGFLRVHPRFWPIVSVVSCSFGSNPQQMSALDVSTAWIEPMAVVFPLTQFGSAWLGQLGFNYSYSPYAEQFVSITYVNGYANALLAANSNVGATSLSVSELAGFTPGLRFTVYDGENQEILTVASTFVPGTGPGTVTLASPAVNAHTAGVSVSALPPAIKEAAIYMTNMLLKTGRGNAATVMSGLTPSQLVSEAPSAVNDYELACQALKPYRRVR